MLPWYCFRGISEIDGDVKEKMEIVMKFKDLTAEKKWKRTFGIDGRKKEKECYVLSASDP